MRREEIRKTLTDRAARLVDRVERIGADLASPKHPDWDERAIELENEEVLERLDEAERRELEAIRDALARLEAGTYGTCSSCGTKIAPARLEALPYTVVCVRCAS
jgi:RNA polymerase-binding protein DksA